MKVTIVAREQQNQKYIIIWPVNSQQIYLYCEEIIFLSKQTAGAK
jgi:hypothetical protein